MGIVIATLTGLIVAVICAVVLVRDTRRTVRIYERERRRKERMARRLHVPIGEHAATKGIDIEDLLILCGAEGWSDGRE